jgi:hypothetical protein
MFRVPKDGTLRLAVILDEAHRLAKCARHPARAYPYGLIEPSRPRLYHMYVIHLSYVDSRRTVSRAAGTASSHQ